MIDFAKIRAELNKPKQSYYRDSGFRRIPLHLASDAHYPQNNPSDLPSEQVNWMDLEQHN